MIDFPCLMRESKLRGGCYANGHSSIKMWGWFGCCYPWLGGPTSKDSEGDTLELFINASGEIILRSPIRKYELEDLLSKITPENRHKEIDWDEPDRVDSYRDCLKP